MRRTKTLFATAASACVVAGMTLPAAAASAKPAAKTGPEKTMIVILRNENQGLSGTSSARLSAVRTEQAPIVADLRSSGARDISTLSVLNAVIAKMTAGEAARLASNPAVKAVLPNAVIPGPKSPVVSLHTTAGAGAGAAATAAACGTKTAPELDPEALANIKATGAQQLGFDGAGVTVAFMADGLAITNPDFRRNAAYATTSSPTGSAVITKYEDFSGDGTNAPTSGGEAFLDSSSIAAQGNGVYDISKYVNKAHQLPAGCDIKIVGAAPGSDVLALKIFGINNDTTASGFVQAINYAIANGALVINQSFGSNNVPDTTLDVIRDADNAAVAAGVTVVVSSGDAGVTSTLGSPSTDPNVISVGASTTFRGYAQTTEGGINAPVWNGKYLDNNISSLSSGGYAQDNQTVDLVAPGDLNWALCDSDTAMYGDCTNLNGSGANIELTGGTSESSPLTAGAAADVIQAYASTHHGTDPSPALVKQILVSTATDLSAPATEQGAGLLNVLGAVKDAESLPGTSATPAGGVLVSPGQINVTQAEGATTTKAITVTNTGSSKVTVKLSTRALTKSAGNVTNSFCMQPGNPTSTCPANSGVFKIWSGVSEVYQTEKFAVPSTTSPSYLKFTADYQFSGQTSVVHVALFEPNGTFAGYSLPQGLGDFADAEVANPVAGKWTAVFFTEQDGATPGGLGTSGTVQWDAATSEYVAADKITQASMTLGPGGTGLATLSVKSPASGGDSTESVVVSTAANTTTIPVTVRTLVPITASGGQFSGVLTGGNGRAGVMAQTNTYSFDVPKGQKDIDVTVALTTDPSDEVIAFLVNPAGMTEAYSSNVTTDNFGQPVSTAFVSLYHVAPATGQWSVILDWLNPVSGLELTEPFEGLIQFGQVSQSNDMPRAESLKAGRYEFHVTVNNGGFSPESYFVDPRLNKTETLNLLNQNSAVNPSSMTLPLAPGLSFPYYFVPPETSALHASISGSAPVTFDLEYFPGDPDVSPIVNAPGVTGSASGDSSRLKLSGPALSSGLWLMNPDEVGPYGASNAPQVTASSTLKAETQAFDRTISSSTGDLWEAANGLSNSFGPKYVPAGDSTTITIKLVVKGAVGTKVAGTLYVDDFTLGSLTVSLPNADVLAAIPYSYTVAAG